VYWRHGNIYSNRSCFGGGTGVWSSSSPAVATVSAAGLVTGISAGTSNIIYTISGGCGAIVAATANSNCKSECKNNISDRTISIMYRRNSHICCQWGYPQRGHGSVEQQQYCHSNRKCCRIGDRFISRYMQHNLYCNSRLRSTVSALQPVIINPNATIASVTGLSPLCIGGTASYTANGHCTQRRNRSMEQQQPSSSNSQCSRIGHWHIIWHLQYYLHNNRWLRRYGISTAICYNKSGCQYYFSNRYITLVYRRNGNICSQWGCTQRRHGSMEQQ